jgi:YgiT-type zinc finger domain-containing protein
MAAADEERWQLHLTVDDEPAWYCPDCAEREFGDE